MKTKLKVINTIRIFRDGYKINSAPWKAIDQVMLAVDNVMDSVPIFPAAPAIDWKVICKADMDFNKMYLLWGTGWETPDVGFMSEWGIIYSAYPDENGGTCTLDNVTHYAEFNKPEGVE